MNLVRSNRRDLLAVRLKEFEKEDLAIQQKEMVRAHEVNIATYFIDLAYEYFRASSARLAKMSAEELVALNELIQQKTPRHLWIDMLRRKVAPAACFLAVLGGICLAIFSLSLENVDDAGVLLFLSLCGTAGGIIASASLFGARPSLWKKYHDSIRFLKKAKGDNYFPIESLCKTIGVESLKEE